MQWDNAFGLGLHYMHARQYAPALGRFLQPDPDGLEDSLYAYAANSPVTEIDPDCTCFIVRAAAFAVVGAVVETGIYLATTDSAQWNLGDAAGAAAGGAATGALAAINPIGALGRGISTTLRVAQKASTVQRAAPVASRASSLLRGPTHLHHTVPTQILRQLPLAVRNNPAVRGAPGAPNRWRLPATVHRQIHPTYNQRWIQELARVAPTVRAVTTIRQNLTQEFGIRKYRPRYGPGGRRAW